MDNQKHTPEEQLFERGILLSDFISSSTYGAVVKLVEENERQSEQIKKLEGLLHKILKESVGGNVPFSFELYNEIKAALNL